MARPVVAIALSPPEPIRAVYREVLAAHGEVVFLADIPADRRGAVLESAAALIANAGPESLGLAKMEGGGQLKLIQFITAGLDHVPFATLPKGVPCAANAGGYAQAMAEHAVALVFACAKRLGPGHRALAQGVFDQFGSVTKSLAGGVCAVLGFGEVGRLVARRLACLGMAVHAINRSGQTDEKVAFIGTLDDLEPVLRAADAIIVTLSLTRKTEGAIGARALGWTKDDAILVNVSRGEIVDETALYRHLRDHPAFFAGIESWWIEPVRHGEFRINHPFLDLPNVIACPHNSARVPNAASRAARKAAENVRRLLTGEAPLHIAGADEMLR